MNEYVSILARTEARALLGKVMASKSLSNVSILARTEARALPVQSVVLLPQSNVSILARTEARALPSPSITASNGIAFQSSPAPRRGRYLLRRLP